MKVRLALVAALALVLAATAAAATSPTNVYFASIAAATKKQSVHYVSVSNINGNAETLIGDAANDRGIQRITFKQGGTTGHVTVIVVGTTAYVRGDGFSLRNYLGLTAAQVSRYSGRWFSMKAPSSAYNIVSEAVRMGSFVQELEMAAPYSAAPVKTFGGHSRKGVRTKVSQSGKTVTIDLYVAGDTHLPVAQIVSGSAGSTTTTLSGWNTKVNVAAPSGALAFH
jgi:hypothetical protein